MLLSPIRLLFSYTSLTVPRVTPTSTPVVPSPDSGTEIVLFVGFPALGKTSFYTKHFSPAGYVHVNQDTLRTRDKCIKAVEETLKDGKSCVVGKVHFLMTRKTRMLIQVKDNTNRDAATRKYYIDLAKKLDVPIRSMIWS